MKRKWFFFVILIVSIILMVMETGLAVSVPFQVPVLPGVNKEKEGRQIVNIRHSPWTIIGRVQTDLGEKCTGFLLNPFIVVTASHCLWIKKTGHFIDPRSVHFLLGYQRQHYIAALSIKRILVSRDYHGSANGREGMDQLVKDWAYLVISDKTISGIHFLPISQKLPVVGSLLNLAGYDQDRQEVLFADRNCTVKRVIRGNQNHFILFHTCQGTFGSSGAPLLMKTVKGQWEIAGIQVAASAHGIGGVAINIPAINKWSGDDVK